MITTMKRKPLLLLLVCLCFGSAFSQALDFSKKYEMPPDVENTVSAEVGNNRVLNASEDWQNSLNLTLTDMDGGVIWSYRYKPAAHISYLQPAAILKSYPFGPKPTAIIYGSAILPASESENYWTSDLFAMKINLDDGSLIWIKTFGTPLKDICKGATLGKKEFISDPSRPFQILSVDQHFIYAFQGDPSRPQFSLGSESILTVAMRYDGNITDAQRYAVPISNHSSRLIPTDASLGGNFSNRTVLITGNLDVFAWQGNAPYALNNGIFTLEIPVAAPGSAKMRYFAVPFVPNDAPKDVQVSTVYTGFLQSDPVLSWNQNGKINLMRTKGNTPVWAKSYKSPFPYCHARDLSGAYGLISVLADESQNKYSGYEDGGLMNIDIHGNFQTYVYHTDHNYHIGANLIPYQNRFLISSTPESNPVYGGFALRGATTEGTTSGDCYGQRDFAEEEINVTGNDQHYTVSQPILSEEGLDLSENVSFGYVFDCRLYYEYQFIGDDRNYGFVVYKNQTGTAPIDEFEAKVYPNPLSQELSRLQISSPESQRVELSFYDLSGKLLYKGELDLMAGANEFSVPVEQLPKGLSIAKISRVGKLLSSMKLQKN